jgi:hypothetical protein
MSNVLKVSHQEAIRSLHEKNWSRRRIARELGINGRTVRRYIEAESKCIVISTPGSENRQTPFRRGGFHKAWSDQFRTDWRCRQRPKSAACLHDEERTLNMTKFRLVAKSSNRLRATFHVTDERGDIVGSISVRPDEMQSLLQCWSGPADRGDQRQPQSQSPVAKLSEAFVSALRRQKPASRAAILRGCS